MAQKKERKTKDGREDSNSRNGTEISLEKKENTEKQEGRERPEKRDTEEQRKAWADVQKKKKRSRKKNPERRRGNIQREEKQKGSGIPGRIPEQTKTAPADFYRNSRFCRRSWLGCGMPGLEFHPGRWYSVSVYGTSGVLYHCFPEKTGEERKLCGRRGAFVGTGAARRWRENGISERSAAGKISGSCKYGAWQAGNIVLDRDRLTVGKQKEQADIVLSDSSVSRIHASLEKNGEDWYLRDRGSTNGTFLDGIRLEEGEKKQLKDGMEIRFSDRRFCFIPTVREWESDRKNRNVWRKKGIG